VTNITALPRVPASYCPNMAIIRRRRFLIVDNNEQESGELVQRLVSLGQEASATWSGRDALDYLASDRFDLLLVDHYVADMYAGEFIDRVLRLPNHPRVVIMKNSGTLESIEYDKSLGDCQVLDKGKLDRMHEDLAVEFPECNDDPVN
jgi:CheY-like chemotaxis protein